MEPDEEQKFSPSPFSFLSGVLSLERDKTLHLLDIVQRKLQFELAAFDNGKTTKTGIDESMLTNERKRGPSTFLFVYFVALAVSGFSPDRAEWTYGRPNQSKKRSWQKGS